MTKDVLRVSLGVAAALGLGLFTCPAFADEATVTVGGPRDGTNRYAEPPSTPLLELQEQPFAVAPELRRSSFRLELGPMGVTSTKGFGFGVGVGASFGSGSVGGRLSAAWLRGEGTRADGTVTPTGDAVGHYGAELTLDLNKRGRLHPIIGMGGAVLHLSRPDTSGFAGAGTGRFTLEYALALDDADVRVGGGITTGVIGPVDRDLRDLRAYALLGAQLAVGF